MIPLEYAVVLGPLFALLIFLAIAGNSLVCVAIFIDRKLRKQENFFLISLSVSDILVAILVMTFAAVNDLMGKWAFGKHYCQIWLSSDVMCCTASILNLCAISFDRYWHIRHPLRYCLTMTRRRTIMIIAVVWLISASISFIPILTIWSISGDNSTDQCVLNFDKSYLIASSAISFFLPCTIMIIAYSHLYCTARTHVKLLQSQFRCLESAILLGTSAMGLAAWRRQSTLHEEPNLASPPEKTPLKPVPKSPQYGRQSAVSGGSSLSNDKAKKTIGVIMGVFLICWFPFFIINIIRPMIANFPHVIFQVFTWIGYANSTANPIIYGLLSRDFRRAFKKILFCKDRTSTTPIASAQLSCVSSNRLRNNLKSPKEVDV